jgi:hypothetical protein
MRGGEKRWGIRQWEPIGVSMAGGPYTSCRLPSAPTGSEIEGISTPNQKGGNSFFTVLIFNEG